jgi:hypothetical protein
MRNEVLENDLLQVSVAGMAGRECFQRFDALVLRLTDADQDSAREWDLQFPGSIDRRQARLRMLGR